MFPGQRGRRRCASTIPGQVWPPVCPGPSSLALPPTTYSTAHPPADSQRLLSTCCVPGIALGASSLHRQGAPGQGQRCRPGQAHHSEKSSRPGTQLRAQRGRGEGVGGAVLDPSLAISSQPLTVPRMYGPVTGCWPESILQSLPAPGLPGGAISCTNRFQLYRITTSRQRLTWRSLLEWKPFKYPGC